MNFHRTTRAGATWSAALAGLLCLGGLISPALAQDKKPEADARADMPAFPADRADAENRLILRLQAGFSFTTTSLVDADDGVPRFLAGHAVGEDMREATNYVTGSLQLGTLGVGTPTLNTYANMSFGLDGDGAPEPEFDEDLNLFIPEELEPLEDGSFHPLVVHPQGDLGIFLHSAYAEFDGFSTSGAGKDFSLRAGRQGHWSSFGSVIFDGATVGYENGKINFAARVGQRAQVYERAETQDDPGLYGGATLAMDFDPVMIRAEYALFSRKLELSERDIERLDIEEEEFTLNLVEVGAFIDPSDNMLLSVRLQAFDAALTFARLGVIWQAAKTVGVRLDFAQKIQEGMPYDMLGGRGIRVTDQRTGLTRNSTYESLHLNIPDRQPFSDLQVQVPVALLDGQLEIIPRGGFHLVLGDTEELNPYDATSFNFGVGAYFHQTISREAQFEVQAEYDGIIYDRTDILGGENAGLMSDVRAGPEDAVHTLYLGTRYIRGKRVGRVFQLSQRWLSLGVGGFARIYQLGYRPYINTVLAEVQDEIGGDIDDDDFDAADLNDTDVLFGARLDAKWWATDYTALEFVFEFAQDSEIFMPHLGPFTSVQLNADIQF